MSVDEVEPIEAEAAEENAVAPQGTHLASTQTITHEYLTQSGKVMRETVTTNQTVTAVMDFVYDESGKPFAMIDQLSAQPKTYYYVLNLQGDVVKLIDQDGAVAAAYTYDAWGNILSQSGSMADANPLRYRGYYYDTETGFYYLQSRYYDPATRRFINADALASTGQGFIGYNMFAYCNNSPVNTCDSDGRDAIWILEGQSAEGAGHVGLLVQDERGSWYYFYWGPQSETASISLLTGTSSAPMFERIDTGGRSFKITGNIMAALKGSENAPVSERALKITRSYYYKGDYTKTYEYCKSVAKVSDDYNLITYNCVQVTCDALAQSDRRFSIKTLIPNIATNRVAHWADVPGGRVTAWSYYSRTHNSNAIK